MPGTKHYETAAEIATRFDVHRETVHRLRRDGRIPFVKIGGSIRFDPDEVEAHIRNTPERVEVSDDVVDRVAALVLAELDRKAQR